MEARIMALFGRSGDWWVASVAEIPGAHSQGKTIEEARENLQDAVQLLLETNRELESVRQIAQAQRRYE